MWLAKPSVDARSEIMTSLGDTMWWRWRQAHPSAPVRLLNWEFESGLAYIEALSEREKEISASDQSATTSGNTFIVKKRCEEESWCAEEMVEQSLAGLESNNQKTNRPWRFMWFLTACLNATKPSGFEKKGSCWHKTKRRSKLLIAHRVWCGLIRGSTSTGIDINSFIPTAISILNKAK